MLLGILRTPITGIALVALCASPHAAEAQESLTLKRQDSLISSASPPAAAGEETLTLQRPPPPPDPLLRSQMVRPRFTPTDSRGTAERLFFQGPEKYRAEQVNYTTCGPGNDDWYIRARELDIDKGRDVGVARGAFIVF